MDFFRSNKTKKYHLYEKINLKEFLDNFLTTILYGYDILINKEIDMCEEEREKIERMKKDIKSQMGAVEHRLDNAPYCLEALAAYGNLANAYALLMTITHKDK